MDCNLNELAIMISRLRAFKNSKVFYFARKAFVYLATACILLFSILSILIWAYEDDVQEFFLSKLNQQLNTKVEIASIELGVFKTFPDASIILNQVKVHHAKPYEGAGHFLTSSEVRIRFSWFDFLAENYEAKRIDIKDGSLQIITSIKGDENFNIFKSNKDSVNGNFNFSLNTLDISAIKVIIDHEPSEFNSSFYIEDARANGEFTAQEYTLQIKSELLFDDLITGKTNWIKSKTVDLDCDLKVNNETRNYSFSEGLLKLAQMEFGIEGSISLNEKAPDLNLELKGLDLNLSSFLSLLPKEYQESLKDYKSDGNFFAVVNIKGPWNSEFNPLVKIDFGIEKGEVEYTPNNLLMENVFLDGQFSNGNQRCLKTSTIKLDNFKFKLNSGQAQGRLYLSNLNDVNADANFKAKLSLEDVAQFLPEGKLSNLKGIAELDMAFEGNLKQMLEDKGVLNERVLANGDLKIDQASFKLPGDTLTYRNMKSRLRFSKYDVFVDQFSGMAGSSDFNFKGSLVNLFGYLLTDNQPIGINAEASSSYVNLDELFSTNTNEDENSNYNFKISPRLSLQLSIAIDKILFRNFNATQIFGNLGLSNQVFKAKKLRLQTMDGELDIQGIIDGRNANNILVSCDGDLKNVNINKFFYQCENFGQNTMTDKHIMGNLDANVQLTFPMDSSMNIRTEKMKSVADITIRDGRLIAFEPLNNLSRFISLDELKDVKFSKLKNTIKIENEKIIIPKMEMVSSALSIFVSGTHSFNNYVDYHFQLTLSDLLSKKAKKAKRENEEFGVVMDDGLGRTQLFVSMTGQIDNPQISYDSKGAKEKFKEDLKEEKQTLKQILKKELGLFKNDTTLKEVQKKKETKVIIEWDE